MDNDLGAQVLLAMTDQGWPWTINGEDWVFWSPVTRTGRVLEARIVTDPDWDGVLRDLLLILIVRFGLEWDQDPRGGFTSYN